MKKTYERIDEVRNTADQIRSGDVVWVGGTEGAAADFLSALSARSGELRGVTLLVVAGAGSEPLLDQLRRGGIRVLSFYKEALSETYRRRGCFGKYEIVTASAEKAVGLVCRQYGVNVMVVPVCQPKKDGSCAVDARQVLTARAVSRSAGIRTRIALVDYSLRPSTDSFRLDEFDSIGLRGDFTTRGIFDNGPAVRPRAEAAA